MCKELYRFSLFEWAHGNRLRRNTNPGLTGGYNLDPA